VTDPRGAQAVDRAKALDHPQVEVLDEADPRVAAWLASLTPAQRAEHEARVAAGAGEDLPARIARQATARVVAALGLESADESPPDDLIAALPPYRGLAFAGLRQPVAVGDRLLTGPRLLTRLPALALASGPSGRRGHTPPPLLLAAYSTGGRDAAAVARRPDEEPVVLPSGVTLRVYQRRELADLDIVLAADLTDPDEFVRHPGALWQRVERLLSSPYAALPDDAQPQHYLEGGLS